MLEILLGTNSESLLPLLLRLFLGLVILPHGLQKLLGWFGGAGFSGSMSYFTQAMRLPWIIGFLVIFIETFGALALIAGFSTRLAALGIIAVMSGAVLTSHRQFGFFMNWFGNQEGEGYEFHLLAIGIALVLLIAGGGLLSLDSLLA